MTTSKYARKTRKRKLTNKRQKLLLKKLVNYKFYLSDQKPSANDMEHIIHDLEGKNEELAGEAIFVKTGRIV